MDCNEFAKLKEKYLQGEMTTSEDMAVEAHLESCPACRQFLDNLMAESEREKAAPNEKVAKAPFEHGLDEKKQRRILLWAKYKNRFSIAAFLLLLLLGLHVAGLFLSGYYFNRGGEESRLFKTQRTAAILTESTFPNVTMPIGVRPLPTFTHQAGWGDSSLEIKPYFVARGNYVMHKQVGKDKLLIGQLNINHLFSSILTQWNWENDAHREYLYFYHPGQFDFPQDTLLTGEVGSGQVPAFFPEESWEVLDVLPEGTVAELSFSFRQTYSIDQVMEMLHDYELDITWYAVCTGQEENLRRSDHPEPLTAFSGAWGLPHFSHNILSQYGQIDVNNYSTLLEDYFMDSLQYLNENEGLARRLYRGNPNELRLTERYAHIEENGIQVYGVVVTGPTKELLKLKELETIYAPALGEIQLWNWFQRSFQGTMY